MTKDIYLEMCDQLGTQPLDSEIPLDFDDLPYEVRTAFKVYNALQDNWDHFNGTYIGKYLHGFKDILELYQVPKEEHVVVFELVMHIDSIRTKSIRDTKAANSKSPSK